LLITTSTVGDATSVASDLPLGDRLEGSPPQPAAMRSSASKRGVLVVMGGTLLRRAITPARKTR
jgi:hypothetical protein